MGKPRSWMISDAVGAARFELSVFPLAFDRLAVRAAVYAPAVGFAGTPFAVIGAAVGIVRNALAVLHAVFPFPLVAHAGARRVGAGAFCPAAFQAAFVALFQLAADVPLEHAVSVRKAVLAGAAPARGLVLLRV